MARIQKTNAFAERLELWAKQDPDGIAYLFVGSDGQAIELRNRQLWVRVKSISTILASNNLTGKRIVLGHPSGIDFITAFFATLFVGAVAIPTPPPRRGDRNRRSVSIIEDSGAEWFLSTSSEIERIRAQGLFDQRIQLLATDSITDYDDSAWVASPSTPDQLAMVQYTSGSTTEPKGVMLTFGNLCHNLELIVETLGIRRDDFGITWLPHYHDMGLIGGLLAPAWVGGPTIIIDPSTFVQNPRLWLQLISDHKVSISGGPDFGYRHCFEKIDTADLEGLDLSCWRRAYVGAEPIRERTLRDFSEKFKGTGFSMNSFFPCYGLAETTLLVTGGPGTGPCIRQFRKDRLGKGAAVPESAASDEATPLVSSGDLLPGETVKIVNPRNFEEVDDGIIGEIWVDSPGVAKGYLDAPEPSHDSFAARIPRSPGQFLRTGDLGFLLDRQLFVTGRLKDLIVIRGVNVYPQDIEFTCERASDALRKTGVAAFSIEEGSEEELIVVAEAERGRRPEWDAEFARIRDLLATEHDLVPHEIRIVSTASLPKTSSGKPRRHACRELFQEGSLKTVANWHRSETETGIPSDPSGETDTCRKAIMEFLSDTIGRELPDGEQTKFSDLGIDSVARMNLVYALELKFNVRIPPERIPELKQLKDVVEVTLQHSSGSSGKAFSEGSATGAIPPSHFNIGEFPEVVGLRRNRKILSEAETGDPYFALHDGIAREKTRIAGREFINFASYNYLGLSGHPEVSEAAIRAVEQFGTSAGASRLISGNREVHEQLESTIAQFLGAEAAITFVSGHATNESTIGHLFGPEDLIVHDTLAHNSISEGARLSGARRVSFPHNDHEALDRILSGERGRYRRALIATEGLFGVDGDVPDLGKFVEIKKRHRCLLLVDEAHSIGTIGKTGRGVTEHCGVSPNDIDLLMGTLSKSLASCGGFIAGSNDLIEYLRYTAPGFVFSVGMPPASAAAALAAIEILRGEPELVARLHDRSRYFLDTLDEKQIAMPVRTSTPIFSLDLNSPQEALDLSNRLLDEGVNAPPLLYPAVAETSGKIRFFVCTTHTEEQIETTLEKLAGILHRL